MGDKKEKVDQPQETPQNTPKSRNTLMIVLVAISVIAASVSLAFAGYMYGQKQSATTTQPEAKKEQTKIPSIAVVTIKPTTPQPDTTSMADWQKFVNQRFWYAVKFPPSLIMEPLAEGDNPMTPDIVEVGDEGTFFSEQTEGTSGMRKTMLITAYPLQNQLKWLTLEQIVGENGATINPCLEDKPGKVENVTTASGVKGMKAQYYVKEGCQGATERHLDVPYVFFDARPRNNAIIYLYAAQIDTKTFDAMTSTFEFTPAIEYSD